MRTSIVARSWIALSLIGCSNDLLTAGADQNAHLAVPSRLDFELVADSMQQNCGTLDCHGQSGRNMRLYGQYGLRLGAQDNPMGPTTTTPAEYDASFASVVGLEPETMSKVVRHAAQPEALAMIRKPRGVELHKGGVVVTPGDSLDRCLTSWLTGTFDSTACIKKRRPSLDGGP